MTRDHFIQLVAALVAAIALVGAAMLVPAINEDRRELQLGFDLEVGDRVPPKYAIAAAALGSFRGIAVDVLWYRAERLKMQDKFYEANTLAEWITTLQPRFPQVWSFHAWNMAYNISVKCHTPQERWSWVNKGIRLLRDEGIVYNLTAVRLYRELAWILFHKVGQYTDDMHWYYKSQFAREWHEVLGAPTEGATTEQALAEFKPIADAADAYFRFNHLSVATRERLGELMELDPTMAEQLAPTLELTPAQWLETLPELLAELRESRRFGLVEELEALRPEVEARVARSTQDPLTLLYNDEPTTRRVVARLRAIGLEPDGETLRRIGRLNMLATYAGYQILLDRGTEMFSEQDHNLLQLLADAVASQQPAAAAAADRPDRAASDASVELHTGFMALMPFLRAQTLVTEYHMDPVKMYELMDMFGPIDWRHPAAHAIYWAALGVEMAGELRDATKVDVLNTDRQVIHGLQSLMHSGRVVYDPFTGSVDLLPDPRFIDAYALAMEQAIDRIRNVEFHGPSNIDTFEAGHENFLLKAVQFTYLYGDERKAEEYYKKLRDNYGDRHYNQEKGKYLQPLEDLVMNELLDDMEMMNTSQAFIDAMLQRAFSEGLALGRLDIFGKFTRLAQRAHQVYNETRGYTLPLATRDRMVFEPFNQVAAKVYAEWMRQPGIDILRRARAYRNTPVQLRQAAFPKFQAAVHEQAARAGLNPQSAFPPPPGLEEQELPAPDAEPATPNSVQRN